METDGERVAIFVTGDTHGAQSLGFGSVDGFMPRLSSDAFPEQKTLDKGDYVVILGDFGGVWDTDRRSAGESERERYALNWLEQKPFTTLFVPGNHENYDRLTGCQNEALLNSWFYAALPQGEKEKLRRGYPAVPWRGGRVRQVRPSVLMLERGYVFELCGKTCFAFGGAASHDISDGILDPAKCPDEQSFKAVCRRMQGLNVRVKGLSWWEQELPSDAEKARGRETLRCFMQTHEQVDFVFTHEAPAADKRQLGLEMDELSLYLESLKAEMRYGKWFYGHLHDNRQVSERQYLLYEQIIKIA